MDFYVCMWNYDKVEICYFVLEFFGYVSVEDMFDKFYFCKEDLSFGNLI